mmetsp:Transcript_12136/g.25705  ORF Transcript_12136/g.25705 Transcript_12136/m.25705 type:complete len:98 (+) Transcript_12136:868-1161(+)
MLIYHEQQPPLEYCNISEDKLFSKSHELQKFYYYKLDFRFEKKSTKLTSNSRSGYKFDPKNGLLFVKNFESTNKISTLDGMKLLQIYSRGKFYFKFP